MDGILDLLAGGAVTLSRAAALRVTAEVAAELALAREARRCIADLVAECNPCDGVYAVPPDDLIEWARRIVRRGQS